MKFSDDPEQFVFPIAIARIEADGRYTPRAITGTGFLIARNLLVTCWHCVRADLSTGECYVAAVPPRDGTERALKLQNIERDPRGFDLATANIDHAGEVFALARFGSQFSTSVGTFGYPMPETRLNDQGQDVHRVSLRFLRGYVSLDTVIHDGVDHPTLSYELDMPAPAGLSGAPLLLDGSNIVMGVVYGERGVASIEQFASVDPVTGARTPEVQRVTTFALAHHTYTLHGLSGRATGGQPLVDLLGHLLAPH